jgi:hypothetical protein
MDCPQITVLLTADGVIFNLGGSWGLPTLFNVRLIIMILRLVEGNGELPGLVSPNSLIIFFMHLAGLLLAQILLDIHFYKIMESIRSQSLIQGMDDLL